MEKTLSINVGDEVFYYALVRVGGRDADGEYELVLEGPAQGEKVYV